MPNRTYHQPDPHLGEAPRQELHFVDGGELRQFETDSFGIYLSAALTLTSTGLSIAVSLAAWHYSVPAAYGVTNTNVGLTLFAVDFLVLGAGVVLFIPGIRNWSSTKILVNEIRQRLVVPGTGEQQSTAGGPDLPPVTRNPALISSHADTSEEDPTESIST